MYAVGSWTDSTALVVAVRAETLSVHLTRHVALGANFGLEDSKLGFLGDFSLLSSMCP